MDSKKRASQNRRYQRLYRKRRREEGFVPVQVFIRKDFHDQIARSGVPLEDCINDALEARFKERSRQPTRDLKK